MNSSNSQRLFCLRILPSFTFPPTHTFLWKPSKECCRLTLFCYVTVIFVTAYSVGIVSAVDPESQILSAQQSVTGTNADLLSYKMFSDNAGAEENEQRKRPTSEDPASQFSQSSLSGRVQRHISPQERRSRRQRKNHGRRRRMGKHGQQHSQSQVLRPLPVGNDTASVVAFKELKPTDSVTIGKPPQQMFTEHGRGFCKAVPFSQLLNYTGCLPVYITNHYCYGACNSFYIPSDNHTKFPPFTSVQGCIPKRVSMRVVKLTCGGGYDQNSPSDDGDNDNRINRDGAAGGGGPVTIRKVKVRVVTKCKCSKIDVKI